MKGRPRIRIPLVSGLVLAVAGLVVGLLLGHGIGAGAVSVESHPLEWDGHRFVEFSPEAKDAYLGGFIAGAGAAQTYSVLTDSIFDPEALEEQLSKLRAERGLHFPYAPHLYHARLHDYYFYIDRRERPIYRAIAELNFQLQTKQY